MAIRERAKALFRSKTKSDRDSQLSKSSSQMSGLDRWPSNVYKPGEAMPKPKYRAPPKKEHKEKLECFSFADAWRRNSFQSQYSPMGTRAPSRRNSIRVDSRRNSWLSVGRKSATTSRSNSHASMDGQKGAVRHREHYGVARPTALQNQIEQEGDDDVMNVGGMSRRHSRDHGHPSRPETAARQPNGLGHLHGIPKTMSTAHDHQPFTEHDLALALQRSHLAVPVS